MRAGRGAAIAVATAVVLLIAPAADARRIVESPAVAGTARPAPPTAPAPGCPGQEAPPGPPAVEEAVAVPPLPWPVEPVGGPGLGGCGDLGPAGVPAVGVAAYVVAELDTGTVLAARAPHARHRPASTIKILLALLVARSLDPDALVDGSADDLRVDGSKAGVGPGGRYTVRQLMAALLLNSGNDAAQALSRAMNGIPSTVGR